MLAQIGHDARFGTAHKTLKGNDASLTLASSVASLEERAGSRTLVTNSSAYWRYRFFVWNGNTIEECTCLGMPGFVQDAPHGACSWLAWRC